jgi:hypothetical protein
VRKIAFSNDWKRKRPSSTWNFDDLLVDESWREFFEGFAFPYGFLAQKNTQHLLLRLV